MKLRSVAMAMVAGIGLVEPASAQSLSQFGMWGEPQQSFKSNLGMVPKGSALASGGARPEISAQAPETVAFPNSYESGSIVIDTAGRRLYYTLSASEAYSYPVAVGKQGFTWTGVEKVSKIEDWPDWIPPAEMRARKPSLPLRMTGGLNNPLGVKAIYLGSTLYRIHGTNDAESIGEAASSGCFRMHNEHVVHLAGLVNANTTVYVLKRLPKDAPGAAPEAKPDPAAAKEQKI
jgi:lipoprotein-anchoring transpeptidase ErfK/SrfK